MRIRKKKGSWLLEFRKSLGTSVPRGKDGKQKNAGRFDRGGLAVRRTAVGLGSSATVEERTEVVSVAARGNGNRSDPRTGIEVIRMA